MPDWVLPAGFALVVEGEVFRHIQVYLAESEATVWGSVYCHRNKCWVRVRRPHEFHQIFLRRQGEPAETAVRAPDSACGQVRLCHPVVLRPSAETRSRIEPGSVEPQVRVGGLAGVFSEIVSGWQGLLWTRHRLSAVEVITVQAELLGLLPQAVELGWKGLRNKWRHAFPLFVFCRSERKHLLLCCLCLTQVDWSGASQPDTCLTWTIYTSFVTPTLLWLAATVTPQPSFVWGVVCVCVGGGDILHFMSDLVGLTWLNSWDKIVLYYMKI